MEIGMASIGHRIHVLQQDQMVVWCVKPLIAVIVALLSLQRQLEKRSKKQLVRKSASTRSIAPPRGA